MSNKHPTSHDTDVAARITKELAEFRSDLRTISHWFNERISRVSQTSTPGEQLDALIEMYSSASITERDAILDRAVERIGALAVAARATPRGTEAGVLRVLGDAATTLVLNGALHQQVVCTVAARLARHASVASEPLPQDFQKSVIDALITVLRVGAPTTRDSAVEALGGLLKHTKSEERESIFPAAEVPNRSADPQQRAKRQYFETLNRRRMMALATAGDPDHLKDFKARLASPVTATLIDAGTDGNPNDHADRLADGLDARADLLRTLTAMLRQGTSNINVSEAIGFLRDGARLRRVSFRELDDAGATQVLITLSRFQESVFSTISVMVRRGVAAAEFDVDVAAALNAIPRTVVGSAELCNANVRATIATIGAASRLIGKADAPDTRKALLSLFQNLKDETPSLWLNVGISEGCLRVLPYLLSERANNDMTAAALDALFSHLHRAHNYKDLFETHRQLIAGECFRHILLRLGALRNDAAEPIETVLLHADTQHVIAAFQSGLAAHGGTHHEIPQYSVDDAVISGIAFETDVLKRSAVVFAGWKEYTAAERAVLTRILAAQLRASSRDIQDLARHTVLRRRYAHLPTVSLPDEERLHYVWTLLAALPAEAAGAADADLQDFINHCGRRNRASKRAPHHTEDLPGHILAMISDAPSTTIAEAIAREIDLNLQHERKTRGSAYDFARALYHVTLRDPDTSVFDHLLPRTTGDDRTLVTLFRNHVETVKASCRRASTLSRDANPIDLLVTHAIATIADIENSNSATLQRLRRALTIFRDLAANSEDVWNTLVGERDGGGVRRLLVTFDDIPRDTEMDSATAASLREPLAETHKDLTAKIQRAVSHYTDLPVGDFKARSAALREASESAAKLQAALERHERLQPPERVMLVAVMAHLRSLFERTSSWWCDEPRRRRHAGDESNFWFLFTRTWKQIDRHNQPLHAPAIAATETERRQKDYEMNLLEPLKASFRLQPPPYHGQDTRFERYYVEWMEAELRIDAIKDKLQERWSGVFQYAYGLMTNPIGVTVLLCVPCVFAAVLHARGNHDSEGLIFFAFASLTIVAIPVIFVRWIRRGIAKLPLVRRVFSKPQAEGKQLYRLEAVLPRLARLIAVPLALIVELDHTYRFAVYASTWILLLLIMVAGLPAWFFVRREIVNVDDQGVPQERTPELRARVRQVMALALAHSFSIAFLFSIVFASTALRDVSPGHTEPSPPSTTSSVLMRLCNVFYHRIDAVPDTSSGHKFATFAIFLPRDAPYDLGAIVQSHGFPPPPAMRPHLRFVFYPTLVITWTALALFVGMFLEGFVKGERLRVAANKLEEGEHAK